MSLFGGSASNARSKNLVEFKAGKMTLHGKLVKPDKRKGLVYIYQGDDSIMHFCWKDRTNGAVEDDLMIFPDDIEYKRVPQCTTGRVYLMKFKSTNKKFFFWMQEPDAEKDEKLWRKLNEYLNNPPPPGSSSSASIGGERGSGSSSAVPTQYADFAGLSHNELQHLLGSMNEQQMQQLFGGLIPVNSPTSNRSGSSNASSNQNSRAQSAVSRVNTSTPAAAPTATPTATTTAPSATTTSTSAAAAGLNDPAIIAASTGAGGASGTSTDQSTAKIQLNDLKNILGQLSSSQAEAIDLADIVTPDVMAPILANKEIQEKLIKYLPDGGDVLPKSESELRNTFTTPQFRRAMYSFSEALKSGQLGPLMQQFNLPVEVANAAAKGNIEEFAKAMEEHMKSQKGQQKPKDDGNDDDNRMDT